MRMTIGDEYIDRVFEHFPDVKDSVDFCAYWFRLAHKGMEESGRAGLVGTNSISQGKSRAASLEYITDNGGYIHEAVSSQVWSGEANVHVSIVNWLKSLPDEYVLDNHVVKIINSSLQPHVDVSEATSLQTNKNKCFQGVIPVGKDFIVTKKQVNQWIESDSKNEKVLKLFSMGSNLAKNPHGKPERWIIDFNDMSLEKVLEYRLPSEYLKNYVKPERAKNREAVMREKWWRFKRTNISMRTAIAPLSKYFTVPRVSKWAIFIQAPLNWLPGDKSVVVASEDFYVLGILISKVHRVWMQALKSTLKSDIAYTPTTCFETFPFPQTPTKKITQQIRAKAIELHEYRSEQMEQKQWGITKLYNAYFDEPASQLYKLHKELDKLVLKAYGFKAKDDILEKLLELNLEVAEKEQNGERVVGPWAIDNPPKDKT